MVYPFTATTPSCLDNFDSNDSIHVAIDQIGTSQRQLNGRKRSAYIRKSAQVAEGPRSFEEKRKFNGMEMQGPHVHEHVHDG